MNYIYPSDAPSNLDPLRITILDEPTPVSKNVTSSYQKEQPIHKTESGLNNAQFKLKPPALMVPTQCNGEVTYEKTSPQKTGFSLPAAHNETLSSLHPDLPPPTQIPHEAHQNLNDSKRSDLAKFALKITIVTSCMIIIIVVAQLVFKLLVIAIFIGLLALLTRKILKLYKGASSGKMTDV